MCFAALEGCALTTCVRPGMPTPRGCSILKPFYLLIQEFLQVVIHICLSKCWGAGGGRLRGVSVDEGCEDGRDVADLGNQVNSNHMSKRWPLELDGDGKWNREAVGASVSSLEDRSLPARTSLAQGRMVKALLWLLSYCCVLHGNNVTTGIWWDIRVSVNLVISKFNYL